MHEPLQVSGAAVAPLSLQELTWRSLADANIGAAYWSLETRSIDVNGAMESTLGLPNSNHRVGIQRLYKTIYKEDRLRLRHSVHNFIRQASADPLELHFRVTNSGTFYSNFSIYVGPLIRSKIFA